MTDFSDEILAQLSKKKLESNQLFENSKIDKKNFCIMPFVNIILEPDGNIGVCRHKGSKFTFGNLRNHSLDEIWASEKIQTWRREFSTGNVQVCSSEIISMQCNQCPELNKLLPYAEIDNHVNPKILRLTANFNGKCNLQCQMCDVWKLPNGFYNEDNFWKPARERFFKNILEVDMLSGEPFIQSDTYKLIDEISSVNPDCHWSITTNLHWKLVPKIKEHLDKIKIKNIILSIDSLNVETYAKIRHPGDLNFVLNNIDILLDYQKERSLKGLSSLNLRMNCLIQKDNWHEAGDVIRFCLNKNIIPFLTFLFEPNEFSLQSFGNEKKVEILNFYFDTLSPLELKFSMRLITSLIISLDKIDYIFFLEKIRESQR
jgi:cyclic pyranopterin phosphate synthase